MGIVSSLSQALSSSQARGTKQCYLAEMENDGKFKSGTSRAFQFFPETVTDNRSVQYEEKTMMGSSHPIYQWVHGSERTISFEAHFVSDGVMQDSSTFEDVANKVTSGIKSPMAALVSGLKNPGADTQVDIAAAIAWLRSYTYPSYTGGKNGAVKPPPPLLLLLEGTQIYSFIGSYTTNIIPVIMRRCDVTYESFFNNGQIRSAVVSLEFAEFIQVGSNWGYVDREKLNGYFKNKWTRGQTDGDKFGSFDVGEPQALAASLTRGVLA